MAVDVDLARAAVRTVERERARLAAQTTDLTGGQVGSTTQRDALLRYLLAEHGVDLPDMKGDTLERRLNDPDLPDAVRELIANRLQASSTSPAKYTTLLNAVSADGRLRGTMQFAGAGRTGRWSGRVFQPQNLMRTPKYVKAMYDDAIEVIKADCADALFDKPIEVIASVVRGAIAAPPGKKYAISDWSNIEGRVLAWHAGEEWKLQAFRDFDAGTGHDLYALAYARAFRVTPESVMEDDRAGGIKRQIGKVKELAFGYQGRVGALVSMSANYGVDLEDMARRVRPHIPAANIVKAREMWDRALTNGITFGLSENAYIVCDSLAQLWREANSNIVSFWWALQEAAAQAIENPGEEIMLRSLVLDRTGNWFRIRLPSGRYLCYPSPRCKRDERGRPSISYMGINQYTKRWQRIATYGGKLAENVTQATARDVLAVALPQLEDAGILPVLHVHDEPVCEVPVIAGEAVLENMRDIMLAVPSWAEGLPLAAGTHYAYRYQKE
jgi:DNA polymerase